MEILDLESQNYSVKEAMKILNDFINYLKEQKKGIVIAKVIHGYGSSDHGPGVIRLHVLKRLKNLVNENKIIAYIPGNFRTSYGYIDLCQKYKTYLKEDGAYDCDNEGVTYLCFSNPAK